MNTDMKMPVRKTNVKLTARHEVDGIIYFYAPANIMEMMKVFGITMPGGTPESWRLRVDPRFDFLEVVAFIVNFES